MAKKKIKHNYTSELELKSLLIRIKNYRQGIGTPELNSKINEYIKKHTAINNNSRKVLSHKKKYVKNTLKARIVKLSEQTCQDQDSYERFGEIILLMVKNILRKPQFSGYTYRDDFYSDASYKILKYLHNFNHLLISERTGLSVNAFAYVSQIIHNSILFIINTKKKELTNLRKKISMEHLDHNFRIRNYDFLMPPKDDEPEPKEKEIIENIYLKGVETNLVHELEKIEEDIERATQVNVYYPKEYRITFDEYNELKPFLKGKISIIRGKK